MKSRAGRIGMVLVLLAVASGFFLCPRMNSWMAATEVRVQSPELSISSTKQKNTATKGDGTSQLHPSEPVTVNRPSIRLEAGSLAALKVISAEKLKEQNYRAYIFKRYADSKEIVRRFPSKRQSEQFVKEEIGAKLVSYLEAQREKKGARVTARKSGDVPER